MLLQCCTKTEARLAAVLLVLLLQELDKFFLILKICWGKDKKGLNYRQLQKQGNHLP